MSNGFSGLDQMDLLMKKLTELGKTIDNDTMEKALQAGAEVVKEKVETHPNIPVSKENKEHARDHIEIQKVSDDQIDIGAVDEFFYLLFHELGAKGGTYKGSDGRSYTTPNIDAKPFMRPAFESNQDEIERAMAEIIKRELGL
ncbi:hypothetical protein Q5O89_16865 [Peribacillus frigoritolerans]|nr:hypothetical protein [Peribacillus frigoritolerans]